MQNRKKRFQNPMPKKEGNQWKIRYRTTNEVGKRVLRTKCLGPDTMTEAEAKRAAVTFLKPINDGAEWTKHAAKTVGALMDRWEKAVAPLVKPATRTTYGWAFSRLRKAKFDRIPLAVLQGDDVQELLTSASREIAPSSVRTLKACLAAMLTKARRWGWIERNPCDGGGFVLPRNRPVRPRNTLTPAQARLLVESLPPFAAVVVQVAALTGLRVGEISALRWDDVGELTLRVDETYLYGRIGSPKTAASEREVNVGPTVTGLLKEWRSQAPLTGPRDFIFSSRLGKPRCLQHLIRNVIRPAVERLGLPYVTWHAFRRSYAGWSREAGVAQEALRDQLGHRSIVMTADVYTKVDRADAGSRVEGLMGATLPGYPTTASSTIH